MTNLRVQSGNKPWADYGLEARNRKSAVIREQLQTHCTQEDANAYLDAHGAITVKTPVGT